VEFHADQDLLTRAEGVDTGEVGYNKAMEAGIGCKTESRTAVTRRTLLFSAEEEGSTVQHFWSEIAIKKAGTPSDATPFRAVPGLPA
jgi:hypothetical protein